MSANPSSAPAIAADWVSRSGPAEGVTNLTARIRLQVGEEPVGVLQVAGGAVAIGSDGEAAGSVRADTLQTLVGLLGGEVHPIVARLQNRVRVDGDVPLILRVFLGLQAGSPWSGLAPRK
jgi:hypothetical protein